MVEVWAEVDQVLSNDYLVVGNETAWALRTRDNVRVGAPTALAVVPTPTRFLGG